VIIPSGLSQRELVQAGYPAAHAEYLAGLLAEPQQTSPEPSQPRGEPVTESPASSKRTRKTTTTRKVRK
jgi:hypothetical protein